MPVDAVISDHYRQIDLLEKNSANRVATELAKQFDACLLQAILKSDSLEQHFIPASGFIQVREHDIGHGMSGQFFRTKPVSEEAEPVVPQFSCSPMPVPETQQTPGNLPLDEFVKSVWPYAVQAASLIGLDPGVLVAQAALETGWGRSIAKDAAGNGSNNLFNIKARTDNSEQSVSIKTTEYIADKPIKMMASFKKYPTVEQSFQDYISLIQGSHRYQAALANASNPERYAEALQSAGYATDPEYANKILSIYQGRELRGALERCGLQLV